MRKLFTTNNSTVISIIENIILDVSGRTYLVTRQGRFPPPSTVVNKMEMTTTTTVVDKVGIAKYEVRTSRFEMKIMIRKCGTSIGYLFILRTSQPSITHHICSCVLALPW